MDEHVECTTCDGTGEVHSHNPTCWDCRGTGRRLKKEVDKEIERKRKIEKREESLRRAVEILKQFNDPEIFLTESLNLIERVNLSVSQQTTYKLLEDCQPIINRIKMAKRARI